MFLQKQVNRLSQWFSTAEETQAAPRCNPPMIRRGTTSARSRIQQRKRTRTALLEALERRQLMAADLIQIGAVYVEEDVGSDQHGDLFYVTFSGGAPNTQLTRLTIDGDLNTPGFGLGDLFFDTVESGRGADHAFAFQIIQLTAKNPNATVKATVVDGDTKLVLDFSNFSAGDLLVFSIDVDEVQFWDPNETDLSVINDGFDPITSGVEFQNTKLKAEFSAPHYEIASGQDRFVNRYDTWLDQSGLPLPADNDGGKRDRSAGGGFSLQQTPKPISLAGTVYVDANEDLKIQSGEQRLAGVKIDLYRLENGSYVNTGHSTTTDSQGRYTFGTQLGLMPGTYQVRESQPNGYYSVGAAPGKLNNGTPAGRVVTDNPDVLTQVEVLLGDQHVTELNFAENLPASISGHTCVVLTGFDCFSSSSEKAALAGVLVELRDASGRTIATQRTGTDGKYEFTNLRAGTYWLVETTPANLLEGDAKVGSAGGNRINGSEIRGIVIGGGFKAINYDFCEITPSDLSGYTYYDQNNNGQRDNGERALTNVLVTLWNEAGQKVAETRTNAQGYYQFNRLAPGTYRITEQTPSDYIPGQASVGTIAGQRIGRTDASGDVISAILLPAGSQGVRYDFGEILPGSIAGRVISDRNGNCIIDAVGEMPLAGVTIELLSPSGSVLQTTLTDADGRYTFDNLLPGEYAVREVQPAGYFQGDHHAGSGGGDTSVADLIKAIYVTPGSALIDYDFCEIPPGSIAGTVFVDLDQDCNYDPGEAPLSGVTITLLDAAGSVVATTQTDAQGRYQFVGLRPGSYTVRESQPAGYLQGGQKAGSGGGDASVQDVISKINLTAGSAFTQYDFCEVPPGSIAGNVFVDLDEDCIRDANEQPLAGVTVTLLDASGNVVATTQTDSAGKYHFSQLRPGLYTIRESQPSGYYQGGQRAGSGGGNASVPDVISNINLPAGSQLVEYDFCEVPPGSIAGNVFVDLDNDVIRDANEQPIAGVTVTLLDASGNVVGTTLTDAAGRYHFANLRPGTYSVRETQPSGYYQGGQKAGSGGGDDSLQDIISSIALRAGAELVNYDFAEHIPGSIAGIVFADLDFDCLLDSGEETLAGIKVELLDNSGRVIATTLTDVHGAYKFTNVPPGTYAVRESQPEGYFQGGQVAPATGGDASQDDVISKVQVGSGQAITEANFCELPPATISGYVFQDGQVIASSTGELPENIRTVRDGLRTADDTPLAGVVLQLRSLTGLPIDSSRALPGSYSGQTIEVRTDAQGRFQFSGLRPGTYHVYQRQPEGFIDSLDTPGTTTGFAINRGETVPNAIMSLLQLADPQANPGMDAILAISVSAGQHSQENNFSEVLTRRENPVPPIPRPEPPLEKVYVTPPLYEPRDPIFGTPIVWEPQPLLIGYGHLEMPTWHLSVINGGFPRGMHNGERVDEALVAEKADLLNVYAWSVRGLKDSTWHIVSTNPQIEPASQRMVFDLPGAEPLAGDFNGDGFDELALFLDGEWFIDINANGRWDENDIWLQLGKRGDQPVVGDWDGDGKDDVGIFGLKWQGDERAIASEPGLPDPQNARRVKAKNVPPSPEQAAEEPRLLKASHHGEARADLIDHVFRFGGEKDVAVSGDFNGDGIATIGTFREGQWMLDVDGDGKFSDEIDERREFGAPGDLPLVGDFDGDGIDELAVVRGDQVLVDSNGNGRFDATDRVFQLDSAEGTVIVGDFDGDGSDEPALHQSIEQRRTLEASRGQSFD